MEEKSFAEFVEYWKKQGYEVHVTEHVLKQIEEMGKPKPFTIWNFLALPFELVEDLVLCLPRSRLTRWLAGWTATLSIMVNRPVYRSIVKSRGEKTYRIA